MQQSSICQVVYSILSLLTQIYMQLLCILHGAIGLQKGYTRMNFGEKIHKLRKQVGLTQADLAKLLGVHPRTVIGYERDGRYPRDRSTYKKLSEIFQVPVHYFYEESSFEDHAADAYGESGREDAKQLAMELSELFATGELSAEDMDNIMYVMHRAYFQYREQKREQERLSLETC